MNSAKNHLDITIKTGLIKVTSFNGCLTANGRHLNCNEALIRALGSSKLRINGISYRGEILLLADPDGTVTVINELELEEYLKGVVPCEVPRTFGFEALKAQAVVARTYTLSHLGRHESEGFDLCASEHC
ncbi:MAG: SpoIID/LytB domain-containing protein, partial [Candidatus Wallbacteria bacterium]|nr:SpoIID/LytB domain-containing protein [Candidatus Wallbacteria bacterium]